MFIGTKGGKMYVIAADGHLITPLVYDTIYNFQGGVAIVGRGKHEVNQFGKVLSNYKYGYLSKAGKLILPTDYEIIDSYSEGFGLIFTGKGYVYSDKRGKAVLHPTPVYRAAPFRGNTAYVEVPKEGFWLPPPTDGRNNGSYTQLYDVDGKTIYGNYLDRQGRLLIPWKFDTLAPYVKGYLRPVRQKGKWGFLDSLAQIKVSCQYDDIDADSAYFWITRRRVGIAGRYGFLDVKTGQLVIPMQYSASKPSQSGLVWVQKQDKWECINETGQIVIPFRYDDALPFINGRAIVRQRNKWGLLHEGGLLLATVQYDQILAFQEGRAIVVCNGNRGFIDEQGREAIPPTFTEVS